MAGWGRVEPRALGLFDLMHVFAPEAKLLNWVRLLMDIWAYIHNHG